MAGLGAYSQIFLEGHQTLILIFLKAMFFGTATLKQIEEQKKLWEVRGYATLKIF